jgi:hypothetical protein
VLKLSLANCWTLTPRDVVRGFRNKSHLLVQFLKNDLLQLFSCAFVMR